MDQNTLSWSAYEFEKKTRHRDWLWYVGLVSVIVAVISFFYGNIFFGIFSIVAGVVIVIYAVKEPKMITVTLLVDRLEISEGELLHNSIPYEKINAFSLDETGKLDKLLLQVRGSFVPVMSIPLEQISADAVRKFLSGKITEGTLKESTSVKLFDRIGF